MGQFDYFSAQAISRKNDYTLYKCPLCGTDNNINSTECKYCRYSLKEFESVYFSRFNNYNEAIRLLEENKIVNDYKKIKRHNNNLNIISDVCYKLYNLDKSDKM